MFPRNGGNLETTMINLGTGEACDQIWKHEEQGETCSKSWKRWKQVVNGGNKGNTGKREICGIIAETNEC